ncbi:MAG TPA: carbon-nitrogen hydrolase family protein [Rhizomicrobium sp.]|nr:carbon-nitrogen hydrolase family protein [Rhizomicrobium sp.]
MKIALAQYPIGKFASLADWQANAARWVEEAAGNGARLLVFPEYGGMELTALLPEALQKDLRGQIPALEKFHADFVSTYAALAQKHSVFIQAPSSPVMADGAMHNRVYFFAPSGAHDFQDKRQMTRFEKEEWGVAGGGTLKIFDIGETKIGIAICYDIEFPLIAHAMAKAGAELILAPSCTDTMAGANRVHVGARARALENQIYVAVAPTVGDAPWSPAVDVNVGWAAVYAMPDRGFPDDGILARGELNKPGWIYVELDFPLLRAARANAQVFTRTDWDSQSQPSLAVTQNTF